MKTVTCSHEYELDGSYLPNGIEDDLKEAIPDALYEAYDEDGEETLADRIADTELDALLNYSTLEFNEPSTDYCGDMTVLTASVTVQFNEDKFKKDFNI